MIKPPQQDRSSKTLDRLLEAAATLIEEKGWANVSMAEIAARANSSVGSLYARFETKSALLDHLDEGYARDLIAAFERLEADSHGQKSLRGYLRLVAARLTAFHSDKPGLYRALVLEAQHGQPPRFTRRTEEMNKAGATLLKGLRRFAGEINRPDPERAIFWALHQMLTTIRSYILFPESIKDPRGPSPDEMAREAADGAYAYLTLNDSKSG